MKRPKRFPTQIIENNNILFSPKEHPEKVSISGLNLLPFPSDIEVVVVESGVILGELQLIGFFKSNGRTYSATINNHEKTSTLVIQENQAFSLLKKV